MIDCAETYPWPHVAFQTFQDAFEQICIASGWKEGLPITPATHCWAARDTADFTVVGYQRACEVRFYHLVKDYHLQTMIAFVSLVPLTGHDRVVLIDAQWCDTAFEAIHALHQQGFHAVTGNSMGARPYLRN